METPLGSGEDLGVVLVSLGVLNWKWPRWPLIDIEAGLCLTLTLEAALLGLAWPLILELTFYGKDLALKAWNFGKKTWLLGDKS